MFKRMRHPEHGFHHPLSPDELKTMRANGWVEDDGAELKAKLATVAAPQGTEVGMSPPGGPPDPAGAASDAEAAEVRAKLKALGIEHHPKLGLAKLKALLPA